VRSLYFQKQAMLLKVQKLQIPSTVISSQNFHIVSLHVRFYF